MRRLRSDAQKTLDDFAFEAARLLIDSCAGLTMRNQVFQLWADAGADPKEAMTKLMSEREVIGKTLKARGGRMGPISGFVIPTLKSIGLFGERIAGHYEEMWRANLGEERARQLVSSHIDLPDDLEAWVNEGYESL